MRLSVSSTCLVLVTLSMRVMAYSHPSEGSMYQHTLAQRSDGLERRRIPIKDFSQADPYAESRQLLGFVGRSDDLDTYHELEARMTPLQNSSADPEVAFRVLARDLVEHAVANAARSYHAHQRRVTIITDPSQIDPHAAYCEKMFHIVGRSDSIGNQFVNGE
ncbi:hypothetical protein K474DRAFT_1678298 [Panus rudis PR-1116 ss-1]|nr:hypothetical protein K474DRAFT_1678298 [Panus rudis PR-1116 ss-1]